MKKLLYIPMAIFGLHSIISFFLAGYFLIIGNHGSAAVYIIFTFSGMFAASIMYYMAKD